MAAYVDSLVVYSHARGKYKAGACHLCADSIAELHAFAAICGFKRSWYHSGTSLPHYDLVSADRDIAIQHGAVPVSSRELILRFGRRSKATISPQTE